MPALPIDALLPDIVKCVEANTLTLLQAEAGAGKTTRVPAALLRAGLGAVYVLEPRRLAARMAARRVAEEMGETLGQSVGYQVRYEEASSAQTKLWYVTEGVLTRRMLSGGGLRDARVVVLDEFHERHLETDLALALLRKRGDLKLLIMSATLGGEELAAKLGGKPPLLKAPGRLFPVSVRYTPPSAAPLEEQVRAAVGKVLKETRGHVLVFLPGAAEIRRAMTACAGMDAKLLALHGDLTAEEQDLAVAPSRVRKAIFSTNVAESSVTIEGVDAVVDSGLARVLTHSPWSGLARLNVERISRASAIQRAGRAGRTSAGIAVRLYSEDDFVRRAEQRAPEILRADLAPTLLLLAAHGMRWEELPWLSEPGAEMVAHGRGLLRRLGAVDEAGEITTAGKRMAELPLHPRLARFVDAAAEMGAKREACDLAARLSEGRVRLGGRGASSGASFGSDIEAVLAGELRYTERRLREQLLERVRVPLAGPRRSGGAAEAADPQALEKALLLAFPDRVAGKSGEQLLLANGGGAAQLARESFAQSSAYVAAIEVDDRGGQIPLVRLATHVEPDWLLEFFPEAVATQDELVWNREAERVEERHTLSYGDLILHETTGRARSTEAAWDFLAAHALRAGASQFAEPEELRGFLQRVYFANGHLGGDAVPDDLVEESIRDLAEECLSFSQMRAGGAGQGSLLDALRGRLEMRRIDEVAPTHVHLPSGRKARIEYREGQAPSVAARLQDFFGMQATPTVARGKVALVLELLAPNQRAVQVTTDLAGFWKNLYPQVRKELSRRYPRHSWPEKPF